MITAALGFALALVCSLLFTPWAIRLARRIGAIDHALSSRKIHKAPVPRLGGIAIAAAFFAPILGMLMVDRRVGQVFYGDGLLPFGLIAGGAIIVALGVYDDLKGSGAGLKFAVQFGVAALAYALGYRIDVIANPFGASIPLGWFGLPFTMLWIAGVINAINLIDGLDGLAGGVAFVAAAMTFVFSAMHGEPAMMLFTATLAGSTLGFLRYNFNPASIFMGDTGSMFLGFVLATSAIHTHQKTPTAVAILIPIVILGLPIADTLLAMSRRAVRGAPLFQADRGHIHHRLLDLGLTQRQTVLVLYGATGAFGVTGLALSYATRAQGYTLLAVLAIVSALALRGLGYMRVEHASQVLALRRRNLELRAGVRDIAGQLRRAAEMGDVWEAVKDAVPVLGARSVALDVRSESARGHRRTHRLSAEPGAAGPELVRTQHSLLVERPDAGVLELGWSDARRARDRNVELAVEKLCRSLHRALARVGPVGLEVVGGDQRQGVQASADAAWRERREQPPRVANLR